MEDRQKVLYVSKKMKEKRQETLERITSDYGTQLRMNRSIQAKEVLQTSKRIWNSDDIYIEGMQM